MAFFYVAFGGALGAVLRYSAGLMLRAPWGTFCVNVLGSLAIGVAFALLVTPRGEAAVYPFLVVGVLGGFTTYSSFSLDALRLVQSGQVGLAAGYVLGTTVLCLAAVTLGYLAGRALA
ncbi:CrcB protein [Candidatus Rhodobacter oscarellae]|uniref:Fluoride-specific ion channel FluC n=1 Tax=Candidatus Rhodobacter oscarellae TaxID=1675527 RepID=A0A0J9GWX8_9RHOB|nr:CrcB family protein [Candidatus Rhodobacter lobularis]KMW58038.1 CrcB protein [Candidatus Rhodobacter lobularis]